MGAWGTALFSDDAASDVRDDYRDYVGDGLSGPEATDHLLEEWRDSLTDPDEGPVFWLALAVTQWKCGRLESRIKDKALEVIESGAGLDRWTEDRKLLEKRKAVLAQAKAQLLSPPLAVKRIPKRFRDTCPWGIGEVIGYRLLSGKWVLFRMIDLHSDKGGTSPTCEMMDWVGEVIPPVEIMQELSNRKSGDGVDSPGQPNRFMILRATEKELPLERVNRTGISLEPAQRRPARNKVWPVRVYMWRSLDEELKRDFGLT
jgi:hypothetical protein